MLGYCSTFVMVVMIPFMVIDWGLSGTVCDKPLLVAKDSVEIITDDSVAEWLRRGPAKLVGYARACSIHVGVANFLLSSLF